MFRCFYLLSMCIGLAAAASVNAACYRITATNTNASSNYYTEPGKGTGAAWDGSVDTAGTEGSLPKLINMNNSLFQPNGTLLATGIADFLQSGSKPYTAEQILYRCTASEEGKLFEFYATNGDNAYAGMYEVGSASGLPETYSTWVTGMGIRVTNLATGEYYSRYWKSRPLTNLDRDSLGWILVKAKNFSNAKIELYRLDAAKGANTTGGNYTLSQPATYIAFQSSDKSTALKVGADSATQYNGWYTEWPGAVNLYNRMYTRRSATCFMDNVTPHIRFPTMSVQALQAGATTLRAITIQFQCQTGAPASTGVKAIASGVKADQTAMGIMAQPENASAAITEGLGFAGSGISYLLSDGYGIQPGIASGVGVQISRPNGTPMNLLSTLKGAVLGGNAAGWYPVLDDATAGGTTNGMTRYTKTLNATFKALPGKTVTAGKYNATAQVIIQVQ